MRTRHSFLTAALVGAPLLFGFACPLQAAGGNPAGDSPLTPEASASPAYTNNVDALFVQLLGAGGMAEVDAGDVAAKKGSDDAVQKFGQRMSRDHKQANQKLERIANSHRIEIGKKLDPDHEAQKKHLSELRGGEFDREYLRTQMAEHQRTALLLAWEVGQGQNEDLKNYAADTLPAVLDHLRMARDILDGMNAGKGRE